MRNPLPWLALGLLALGSTTALPASDKPTEPKATCQTFGTSVEFEKSPSDAAKRAKKEEKLVMVLHISGIFEDPDLT
jgi:hypothetical protein